MYDDTPSRCISLLRLHYLQKKNILIRCFDKILLKLSLSLSVHGVIDVILIKYATTNKHTSIYGKERNTKKKL